MNMTRKVLLAALIMVIMAGLAFAGGGQQGGQAASGGASGGKIAVTFAGTEGATAGQSRMMQEVADILNATGRFDVKVYVAGALPGDTDNLVTQARL
ncbi:MAG: C4-dicarboxylate ABC transporter substrate-binding protein, partial [Treponema sp.]|nr:C4-dicarboxylate ABC transporter substrate-binding protein [Treponema sp.]